jgi:ribosomal protein S18 acetylase RimI-like enzyme
MFKLDNLSTLGESMKNQIVLTSTITHAQRQQVANLFLEAFPKKFSGLWLFSRKPVEALPVLSAAIRSQDGIYALRNDEVVGFIGLESGSNFYTHLTYQALRNGFGVFGALWRRVAYSIFRLFHGKTNPRVLHIDPIVVSESARGLGIGSRLLDAALERGKNLQKESVILEVVDTNPDALRLYKRKGFLAIRVQDLGWLAKGSGFQRIIHMANPLRS